MVKRIKRQVKNAIWEVKRDHPPTMKPDRPFLKRSQIGLSATNLKERLGVAEC